MSVSKDAPLLAHDRSRQARQVLQRVKRRLLRKLETHSAVPWNVGNARNLAGIAEPRPFRRLQLAVEEIRSISLPEQEVARHALEVAGNLLFVDDSFNAIDCGQVTRRRLAYTLLSVYALKPLKSIVEHRRQVRGGARGLTAADWPVIEHHHVAACTGKMIRGRQPHDACADDAYVARHIFLEGCEAGHLGSVHPDRYGVS